MQWGVAGACRGNSFYSGGLTESNGEKGLPFIGHQPCARHLCIIFFLTASCETGIISSFLQIKKASLRETKILPKVSGRMGIQKYLLESQDYDFTVPHLRIF